MFWRIWNSWQYTPEQLCYLSEYIQCWMCNVSACIHQPASGNWFLHNVILMHLKNYVCKEIIPKLPYLMHLFNLVSSNLMRSFFQHSYFLRYISDTFSSCHSLSWQRSCNIFLPLKINGYAKPEGSYNDLNVERIRLLVMFLAFRFNLKQSRFFSTFQCTPKTLSIGNSSFPKSASFLHPFSFGFLQCWSVLISWCW